MRPIETYYAGCRFRSRLEARWAVFFDALGITWEYEPQGFVLSNGLCYLPDFWLPGIGSTDPPASIGTWFEVKGVEASGADKEKIEMFESARLIVATGQLPDGNALGATGPDIQNLEAFFFDSRGDDGFQHGWDAPFAWCVCAKCGAVGVEFEARSERIMHDCNFGHKCYTGDHPRIAAAYLAATGARFEHGER